MAWTEPQGGGLFQPISREGGLLLNNLLLSVAAAAVLVGTLYPLVYQAITDGKISVGPPFFNAVFVPLMAPLLVAMAVGPLLPWKRGDLSPALRRLWVAAVAVLGVTAVVWSQVTDMSLFGFLGMALAAWLLVGTLVELAGRIRLFRAPITDSLRRLARLPRSALGMTLAHAGLAIAIAGMAGAGAWKIERIQVMAPGDTVTVAGFTYTFEGAQPTRGPNYIATRGTFTVTRNGKPVATLEAEKRRYPVEKRETTEAAIHPTFWGDLYVVIGDQKNTDGAHVTRIYFNPMIGWLWAGVAVMVIGGAVSLSDRRHRVGAPSRRRADVFGGATARS